MQNFRWIYFVIYAVLLIVFMEVAEPSFIEILLLFGIIMSSGFYIRLEKSKEKIER